MNDVSRSVLIVVLLVILVPLLSGALMMGMMGPGMMDGSAGSNGWSPWQGVLAMLSVLLVVGGIAAIVWWAFGRRGVAGAPPRSRDEAHTIADERYARGELTREQYQQIVRDLEIRPAARGR